MPTYAFKCITPEHPKDIPREFVKMVYHVPKKVITQYTCPECGGLGKRDLASEIPTQAVVGLTPISHSTTTPGSLSKEIGFAFGNFKKNPDGTEDRNHTAFRDTGELNKYMNGHNDLGAPVLNDKGEPMRRPDGSCIRQGAKLVKYSANKTPSKTGLERRRFVAPSAWTDESGVEGGSNIRSIGYGSDGREIKTSSLPKHHSPERKARG